MSSPAQHCVRVRCKQWRVHHESSMIHNKRYSVRKLLAKQTMVACAAFVDIVDWPGSIARCVAGLPSGWWLVVTHWLHAWVGRRCIAGFVSHVGTYTGMGTMWVVTAVTIQRVGVTIYASTVWNATLPVGHEASHSLTAGPRATRGIYLNAGLWSPVNVVHTRLMFVDMY